MASLTKIFSWFETGDFPTQEQFQETFSSFFHKSDKVPGTSIEGIPAKINNVDSFIKIWVGDVENLPEEQERMGTKTIYIALSE
jgi:hypothetical protein